MEILVGTAVFVRSPLGLSFGAVFRRGCGLYEGDYRIQYGDGHDAWVSAYLSHILTFAGRHFPWESGQARPLYKFGAFASCADCFPFCLPTPAPTASCCHRTWPLSRALKFRRWASLNSLFRFVPRFPHGGLGTVVAPRQKTVAAQSARAPLPGRLVGCVCVASLVAVWRSGKTRIVPHVLRRSALASTAFGIVKQILCFACWRSKIRCFAQSYPPARIAQQHPWRLWGRWPQASSQVLAVRQALTIALVGGFQRQVQGAIQSMVLGMKSAGSGIT